MAQSLSFQSDSVPAASRRTASTQTAIVANPADAEAQSVLHVWYDTCIRELDFQIKLPLTGISSLAQI